MLIFPARKDGIEIHFHLVRVMTFSYRDTDLNDKCDLTSGIKQFSFSLTPSKLHSCALLYPEVSSMHNLSGSCCNYDFLRSIRITGMLLNRVRAKIV